MDRVAVAQLIFSGTSTEASYDFANRDQKSLFATFQSHSSISSIKSVHELQCHSVNVRAKCASIYVFTTSSHLNMVRAMHFYSPVPRFL